MTEKLSEQPDSNKGGREGVKEKGNPKQSPINTTTGSIKELPLAWEYLHKDYNREEESEGGGEGSAQSHKHEIGYKVKAAFSLFIFFSL